MSIKAAGLNEIAKLVVTDTAATGDAFDAIAIGVGTGGTTALNSESTTNGGARRHGANVTGTTDGAKSSWVTTFTFTGSLALTEAGLLNADTDGVLLAYQEFDVVNVVDGDTLELTFEITFSEA
jgi:hypothetical protein